MKSCQAECGATCDDTVEIKTSVSLSNFPSQKLSTEFSKTIGTLNSKMKNATSQNILLDIYYSSMRWVNLDDPLKSCWITSPSFSSVLVIETSEKTSLFTIIASIGGHLGLWIGASLITAVQAIYYLLAACIEAIASKNKRKAPKIETILAS